MKNIEILFVLLFTSVTFSQITSSKASIEFVQLTVTTSASSSLYLKNHGSKTVYITKVFNSSGLFTVSDSVFNINGSDSISITITYTPSENVVNNNVITFMNSDSTIAVPVLVKGSGKYNDLYDGITFNLYDSQLKAALTAYTSGHTSLGYNTGRDKMFETVDDYGYDTIECVYIGRKIKAVNRTEAQNQNFNTEHTWPQSTFSESEPMRSDLYHLYPTDALPNNARSNYPFGNVVSNITYEVGGSKLGRDASGSIVFEPRSIHKGNAARSMFYFVTRYPSNYGAFFTTVQETVFREWTKTDTVDEREKLRNDRIAVYQLKRNPFIDHPEFVDRIYSFLTTASHPVSAALDIYPVYGSFDSTVVNDSTVKTIYIVNNGNGDLNIDSITVSNQSFKVKNQMQTVQQFSYSALELVFKPDSNIVYSGELFLYTPLGIKTISLTGVGKNDTISFAGEEYIPAKYILMQNYPNPFNPTTNISFSIPSEEYVTLRLYDILGNEIAVLYNGVAKAGINTLSLNASRLSSGVYIYKIKAGSFNSSKVMTLLK